jgi:hypothetical protein
MRRRVAGRRSATNVMRATGAMLLAACAGGNPTATHSAGAPGTSASASASARAPASASASASGAMWGSTLAPAEASTARFADAGVGSLPPDVIQKVVRGDFDKFSRCYALGLSKNPKLEGSVLLRFVIDPSGGVSGGQSESASTMPDKDVVACILRELKTVRFPQPNGGFVTVVYPLVFKPG